jgi:hypothetical protein
MGLFAVRYFTEYFSSIMCVPPERVGDVDGTVQVGGEHGSRQPVVVPVHTSEVHSWTPFLVEVPGHYSNSSLLRLEFLSGFLLYVFFSFYKMLFMNRFEFFCFADFFVRIFKFIVDYGFFNNHL